MVPNAREFPSRGEVASALFRRGGGKQIAFPIRGTKRYWARQEDIYGAALHIFGAKLIVASVGMLTTCEIALLNSSQKPLRA